MVMFTKRMFSMGESARPWIKIAVGAPSPVMFSNCMLRNTGGVAFVSFWRSEP